MKKIVAVILIVVILYYAFPIAKEYFDNTSHTGNPVTVEIPEGALSDDIFNILKQNNLAANRIAFKLKLKTMGAASKLRFGTFELNDGMCLKDIISELVAGGKTNNTVKFTVPEGFSVENIAQRAQNLGFCTEKEFLDALNMNYDYAFLSKIPRGNYKYKLQGFLFPSTYEFYKDAKAYDIINTMLGEFEKQYNSTGASINDVYLNVIKASLIERESLLDSEKPIISGVIKNRIEADMLLQIDASVVYAVTNGIYDKNSVTYNDLKIDSVYNTYKYKGLPAGAICNPGIKAIQAAITPQNHNYYYYHTDTDKNDGSHIFTENYNEHLNTMN